MVLTIAIVALVLGAITAGAYFYLSYGSTLFSKPAPQQPSVPTNQNTAPQPNINANQPNPPANSNQPTISPAEEQAMLARDVERVKDILTIAQALDEYFTKFNAYPQFLQVIPKDILAEEPKDPLTQRPYTYTPRNNRLSYAIVFDAEKQANFNGKILAAGSWEFYPEDYKGTGSNTNTNPEPGPGGPGPDSGNLDADGDGLTAAEELLFTTSAVNPDTDGDGYRDNIEINNFFSPVQTGAVTLNQEGLVKLYTNDQNGFSFYYPTSWVVSVPQDSPKETLITSTTGENFSILISDNPDSKTSWEWYTQNVSHDYNPKSVNIVTIAGHEAVKSLDGLSAYTAVGNRVFSIKYTLNNATVIKYPTVFALLLDRLTIQ